MSGPPAGAGPAQAAQLDPARVLDPDRFLDYERSVRRSRLVEAVAAGIDRPGLRVCDVGGASGVFLRELSRRAPHAFEGTVLEVSGAYRERLVDPSLRFVEASVLDSGLADGCFDRIVFRHVLHHLVGAGLPRTRALQERALAEMLRLLAPGGLLVFEEEVNRVGVFGRAVYWLSRFASRHRLRWRFFETGTVVVGFMTPAGIDAALASAALRFPHTVEARDVRPRTMAWRWRLTLLMGFVADAFYAVRRTPPPAAARDGGVPSV